MSPTKNSTADGVQTPASAARERRAHRRAGYRGRLWLAGLRDTYWARIRDLSPGGMGIDVNAAVLCPGTHLQVGFDLPSGGRVVARAVVTRHGDARAGLRFVDMDATSANDLSRFVVGHAG